MPAHFEPRYSADLYIYLFPFQIFHLLLPLLTSKPSPHFPFLSFFLSFFPRRKIKMNDLMTKSFMSYVDLKKAALKDDLESGVSETELEMAATDENLRQFFEEAELVKEEMASIRELLISLQKANDEGKSLHKVEDIRSVQDRINSDIHQISKKAKGIKSTLEAMDESNAVSRRLSGCREGTPADRTRTAVTNGLRKKLREFMMEFQALRQKMMAEYKETVERRVYTITGEVPEESVIDRIISDGHSEEILKTAIMQHGRGKVLETVQEIQGRYDAAKEVEKSLLELHSVFMDMAVMVEAQGEKMDDIEHHVASASHYVKDANRELKTARTYQRSNRRCLCIGIILLLIVILIVVVPIATSFKHS
ncbi:hypothetical protein LUZ60_014131 [Juncus effusus]|nr:hypothetical protein LUZ60_014131 [Juncus effusus]